MTNWRSIYSTLVSTYYTLIMYLFRVFSVLLMLGCVLFLVGYILSFFSDKWGAFPRWSIFVLVIPTIVSVVFWKVSFIVLDKVKKGRTPFN